MYGLAVNVNSLTSGAVEHFCFHHVFMIQAIALSREIGIRMLTANLHLSDIRRVGIDAPVLHICHVSRTNPLASLVQMYNTSAMQYCDAHETLETVCRKLGVTCHEQRWHQSIVLRTTTQEETQVLLETMHTALRELNEDWKSFNSCMVFVSNN
jgi:hypothetical protein